ncbi:histidine kinase [Aquincola sp. S2]|uniref:Histidine kinase n=1 Tax=Pseudaquabacterium terrae TaxID=2732868 RepID=A0ABX2ENH1_9BURK|nr:histidine kinase [Aquabacterium terrae]NRF70029.1 histidine kinase [Aquabacterium terrae]
MPTTDIETPDTAPSPRALEGYAGVLASFALGLAALVVALATHKPRMALLQVLPTVVAMLFGGGAAALWLLRRRQAMPLWALLVGPALATSAAMLGTVLLLATLHGKVLGVVFARPIVERGLLAAPLLGALVGGGLWLLERTRQRERAAWAAQQLARAHEKQLQHERALAQLQLLQAQIEPHFIYNTLANLRQLVKLDSARALQMLDHLIRYFKLVLPSFRADRLPLRDELALVEAYLDLLRERMGRAMTLQVDLPEAFAGLSLLPGALLCLTENAVKHGLPEDDSPLRLQIGVRRIGATLLLTVRDNGGGLSAGAPAPAGTGLANLRERLRLLYGAGAELQLHNAHPGCEAVLVLPWEEPRGAMPDNT